MTLPRRFSKGSRGIPSGKRSALHRVWSAPNGAADFAVFEAQPGRYDYEQGRGLTRSFFELNTIMTGRVTVTRDDERVTLEAGDTYVMEPGWTGTWEVEKPMQKAVVWVYV